VAAAVDVRGGAPGTIGTDALDPVSLVGTVDAIALSGGSSYGLDAAGGVMAWLGARGAAFVSRPTFRRRRSRRGHYFRFSRMRRQELGRRSTLPEARARGVERAGTGILARQCGCGARRHRRRLQGRHRKRLAHDRRGFHRRRVGDRQRGRLANHSVYGCIWPFRSSRGRNRRTAPESRFRARRARSATRREATGATGRNTTVAVVATDADLTRVELKRLAIMAADGFRARSGPCTRLDGDTVFALSTRNARWANPALRGDAARQRRRRLRRPRHRARRLRSGDIGRMAKLS